MDRVIAKESDYVPAPMSLASRVRKCQPVSALAGRRLSLHTTGSLQKGLAEICRERMNAHPDVAAAYADLALIASGLVRLDRHSGLSVVRHGLFRHLSNGDIEQAVAFLGEPPLQLCHSALKAIPVLPASLTVAYFNEALSRGVDNEPDCLLSDLYNAGLFADDCVTLSRFDQVMTTLSHWQTQRQSTDPACTTRYLEQLEGHLSESYAIAAVQRLQRKLHDAVPYWRLGQRLNPGFFRVKVSGAPGLTSSLSVIGGHVCRSQQEASFPWALKVYG